MTINTANRLKHFREQHHLSPEELAQKVGVSPQEVEAWETAAASPDTDTLIRLSELYGVSLDELLKGNADDADKNTDEDAVRQDRVSFKNGIHVDSKDGNHVHISFKDGVNVYEKVGNEVHVNWDGVNIKEKGKQRVYTDENGKVVVDEELKNAHWSNSHYQVLIRFPFWALALAAFLAWGFSELCFGWALSWLSFLSVPLYYSLIDAIFKRNPTHFAFPVLAVAAYIIFGFFHICGGWSMGWLVFLTITVYYIICSIIKNEKQ